jgi:Plant transposase (Ptta/En/Spm family)
LKDINDDDMQAVSERNKRARAMLKTTHTSGTKSFARKAHEMVNTNKKNFLYISVMNISIYCKYQVIVPLNYLSQKMNDPEKKEPNRAVLYLATHKRPDGTYLDNEVAVSLKIEENKLLVSDSIRQYE